MKIEDFVTDGKPDFEVIAAYRKPLGWSPGIEGTVRHCEVCGHEIVLYRESAKRQEDGKAHLVCLPCFRKIVERRNALQRKPILMGGVVQSNEFDWDAYKKEIH